MKLYTEIYIVLVLLTFLIDFLLYKHSRKSIFIKVLYIFIPALVFIGGFTWVKFFYKLYSAPELPFLIMWFNSIYLLIYIPKLSCVISNLIKEKTNFRKQIVNNACYLLVFIFVSILIYSTLITPNRIKVTKIEIAFPNLPSGFRNYTIVQLSDIHLGSRPKDYKFYKNMIDSINSQSPDLVVFTGDMVNNFASEMNGFDTLFLQIKAKSAKFAVLGNHDYGDYTVWNSTEEKTKNLNQIKKMFQQFGFRLLNNEAVKLKCGNDSIELIGVENYSKKITNNYSDLKTATKSTDIKAFKLLLSHNPEHWEDEILPQSNIDLTLSGHTHAAQMGIKINNKIYSPAAFLYPQFNGVYEKENQKIYVSRGVGVIGLPIRIGLNPEITVIKLKQK